MSRVKPTLHNTDGVADRWAARVRQRVTLTEHVAVIGASCLFATVVYLLLIHLIPLHFSVPESTALNWLTLHKYPKQQDYWAVFSFIGFAYGLSLSLWLIYVSLKSRQ